MRLGNNIRAVTLSVLILASSVVPSDANDSGGFVYELLHSVTTGLAQEIVHGVQYLFTP